MRIRSAPGNFCVTLCLPFLGTSCEWTHLSFCVWLVLLSVMFSGFILVVACMRIPFFSLNRILLSADSKCLPFQLSACCEYAVKNMGMHIAVLVSALSSSGYILRSGIS